MIHIRSYNESGNSEVCSNNADILIKVSTDSNTTFSNWLSVTKNSTKTQITFDWNELHTKSR